jgi:hypothetical protein
VKTTTQLSAKLYLLTLRLKFALWYSNPTLPHQKANEYANSFGKGKTEISIRKITKGKLSSVIIKWGQWLKGS